MELIRRLLVGLLGMIDAGVYYLVEVVYGLLLEIANANPFSADLFTSFANRVYALLGLFMLFKVSFSLIKYIVNPDEFNDKVKGGKKLVINILVVLVLIVATPIAFEKMSEAQQIILEEGILEKIIIGGGADVIGEIDRNSVGSQVKVAVFSAFYRPDDATCAAADPADTDSFVSACSSFMNESVARAYSEEYKRGSVDGMIQREVSGEPIFMQKRTTGDGYAINYMFLISTVAGVFTAWIFLVFCVDIAIRTVKLGFLQLIAPIPIISYIDPSSGKSGMFNKWLKEVGKTWADLFIRLGAVYFAITLIAALMQNSNLGTSNFLARVFILFGILIFANQIPKLIGDILGVKIDGNFSLNPLNKVNSSPLASAVVGGAMGFAGGAAANLYAAVPELQKKAKEMQENGGMTGGEALFSKAGMQNVGKNLLSGAGHGFKTAGSMIGGAGSSMVRSGMAGADSKTSIFKASGAGIAASSRARNARDGGYNAYDKLHDKWTDTAGVRSKTGTTSELGDKIKANQQQIANYKRDEQSYSQQMADIARVNPNGYNQAFETKVVLDANGDVARDADGQIITQRTHQTYDSYIQSAAGITEAQVQAGVQARINSGQFSNDDAGRAQARQYIYDSIAQSEGHITQKQFDDYGAVLQARDRADDEARKLEKRNKELQGYLDAKSGKPKQ